MNLSTIECMQKLLWNVPLDVAVLMLCRNIGAVEMRKILEAVR